MKTSISTACAAALFIASAAANAETGYYRYPAIAGDKLVFTAEGDLWTVPLTGGKAARLTTHPGQEIRAAASLDGKRIAFNAGYDGPSEVYVMAVEGGAPKRVTYEGGDAIAIGWTPAGEVLYATQSNIGPGTSRILAAVDPDSLKRHVLPVSDAADGAIAPDGHTLIFGRWGLGIGGDNARSYRGGMTAKLWRYDLKTEKEAEALKAEPAANDRHPMVAGDRIYFLSDRDGRDNLWSMALDGSDRKQVTHHADLDIRDAAIASGRVVYRIGADIHLLELASGTDRKIDIDLASDFAQRRSHVIKTPLKFFESASLAPLGDKVAITARGRIALAGLGQARRVDLGLPPATRAHAAAVSPDGKWVYAFSDAAGEMEIWRYPADGGATAKQLTQDAAGYRNTIWPSPDGHFLAHDTHDGRLFLLNLETQQNQQIDSAIEADYGSVAWSTDGKALAFTRSDDKLRRQQLFLYDIAGKRTYRLTSDKYESAAPAFSADGKWLYFLSERRFQASRSAPWGDRNMGPFFDKRTQIYALALQPGVRFPFQTPTELDAASPKAPDDAAKKDVKDAGPKVLPAIDYAGLSDRLFEVPAAAGNYAALAVGEKHLFALDFDGAEGKAMLKSIAIDAKDPKVETFMGDLRDFALSADRKKIFLRKWHAEGPGDMLIVEAGAKAPSELKNTDVKIGDWSVIATPTEEWREMFHDAWRMHRDFFYDATLKTVDWKAVAARFEPLLTRLTDRAELDDLLGQMTFELGALHSRIVPGDLRQASDVGANAYLGAITERETGGFRIKRIYATEAELPNERGPLSKPGVDAHEGDLITAVNGKPVGDLPELGEALRDRGGQQVLLSLNRQGKEIKTVATPVDGTRNAALRYGDWELARRARVEAATNGRVGYLHLRAMSSDDIATFAREFYAQYDRDALIIDVRRNNGGNIDSWVIEKLLRRAWAFWQPRYGKNRYYNMQQTFRGHLAVLIDERTYSDGETFAAGIKALKLAPLIGKRTAGAGVWLTDRNNLIDRGRARVAELPQYLAETGEWMVEGKGVTPDIEVENPPHATFLGGDAQLEAAIKNLQDRLAAQPIKDVPPGKMQ